MRTIKQIGLSFGLVLALLAVNGRVYAGGSTGGGDYILGTKVTKDEASTEIQQIKPYVVAAFNTLDIILNSDIKGDHPQEMNDANKVLFMSKPNVFAKLKDSYVNTLTDLPCEDDTGSAKAGSVYNTRPNEICLSVKVASELLTTDNLFQQTVGIYAHEMSHKMGADEHLAVWIQSMILSQVSSTSKAHFENTKFNLRHALKEEMYSISMLDKDPGAKTDSGICGRLDEIADDAKLIQSEMASSFDTGLVPVSKSKFVEAVSMSTQGSLAEIFCRPKDSGTSGIVSTDETIQQIFSNSGPMYRLYKGKITIVAPGDHEALQRAIHSLQAAAQDLARAVQK